MSSLFLSGAHLSLKLTRLDVGVGDELLDILNAVIMVLHSKELFVVGKEPHFRLQHSSEISVVGKFGVHRASILKNKIKQVKREPRSFC